MWNTWSEWMVMSWAKRKQVMLLNSNWELYYMLTKTESEPLHDNLMWIWNLYAQAEIKKGIVISKVTLHGNMVSWWERHSTCWLQHRYWSGQLCQRFISGFSGHGLLTLGDLISESFKVTGISNEWTQQMTAVWRCMVLALFYVADNGNPEF
jgi:hypothetical protein